MPENKAGDPGATLKAPKHIPAEIIVYFHNSCGGFSQRDTESAM